MDNENAVLNPSEDAVLEPQMPAREKPDGEEDPAGEAGWYLQQEREARGETIEYASEMTGVHPYHIEAIEYGDMSCMPERMEALEMIGVYAIYLGFDPEPLLNHYVRFLPRPEEAAPEAHPANPPPLSSAKVLSFAKLPKMPKFKFKLNRIPGGTGGIAAALVGVIALVSGSLLLLTPNEKPQVVAEEEAAAPVVDPMPTASTEESEPSTIQVAEAPLPPEQPAEPGVDETAGTGLDGLTSLIEENVAPASPEPPAAPSAANAEGRAFGDPAKARLVLKAKANVWMRVEDAQGNVVMTQMLMKGDTYHVPDREGLVVIARDGGLLSYVIDGQEKGVLGTPGEILVGRPLDIKALAGNG